MMSTVSKTKIHRVKVKVIFPENLTISDRVKKGQATFSTGAEGRPPFKISTIRKLSAVEVPYDGLKTIHKQVKCSNRLCLGSGIKE